MSTALESRISSMSCITSRRRSQGAPTDGGPGGGVPESKLCSWRNFEMSTVVPSLRPTALNLLFPLARAYLAEKEELKYVDAALARAPEGAKLDP